MQNTIYTLEELFCTNVFKIPQYQRAYSWDEDPNLKAFLYDLRQQVDVQKDNPNKQYYLGTLHGVCASIILLKKRFTTTFSSTSFCLVMRC
jgi:hypothetical protein